MNKLCPNCEELLKPTANPEVGQCSGCGWSGHYWRAAKGPALPADPPKLPDSKTCYERAGMNPKVAHTALEDALAVVQLVRTGVKRLRPC